MTNQEFLEKISLEGEEWRPIEGYEGKYAVSNKSRVASLPRHHNAGRVLKPALTSHGYHYVSLYDINGKRRYVGLHRIVAEAWIPNPNNFLEIDHINTDRTDNRIENLRWCDHFMNMSNPISVKRNSESRLGCQTSAAKGVVQHSGDKIIAIYRTSMDAAKALGTNNFSGICACCRKVKLLYKGFEWSYLKDFKNLNISDVNVL